MDRRDFIKKSASAGLLISAATSLNHKLLASQQSLDFVVTKNGSPAQLVRKAVEELGGMEKFVHKGQTVLLKPNMAWDRTPEQAANTNPEVIAEIVKMCLQAGAKKVRVLDRTCNQPQRCYQRSGIESAAKKAGAEVRHIVDSRFQVVDIPDGELIKSWPLYRDILEFDVFINVPIAKHHSTSGITLGFKNIMGLMGGNRGDIHKNFHTNIVDINTCIKPTLTIIDAYRILLRNGPSGGSLDDVEEKKIVIAGTDRVAIDAYAVSLFGKDPKDIEYIQNAGNRGLGQADLSKVKMNEIDLSA